MKDLLEIFNLELTSTGILDFIIGLISIIIFSLLVRKIYLKYSNSVSNKELASKLFPVFGIAIFLIVITIKSSIVLSLGLVGALSIIRFRTAIKEPEQIIYFLIITAVAIATAAGSFLFPLITILFLFVYLNFISKKNIDQVISNNDQLVLTTKSIKNITIKNLVTLLTQKGCTVEIQSINKKADEVIIILKLSDFNFDHIDLIETFLHQNNLKNIELQFFSSVE